MIVVIAQRRDAAVHFPNLRADRVGDEFDDGIGARSLGHSGGLIILRTATAGIAEQALTAAASTASASTTAATGVILAGLSNVDAGSAGVVGRLEQQIADRIKPCDHLLIFLFLRGDTDNAVIDIERER